MNTRVSRASSTLRANSLQSTPFVYAGNVYTPAPPTTATPNRTLLSHQTHTPPSALPHCGLLARGAPTSSALSSTPPRLYSYRPQRLEQCSLHCFGKHYHRSATWTAACILNAIDHRTINDGVFLSSSGFSHHNGAGQFRPICNDVTTGTLGAANL